MKWKLTVLAVDAPSFRPHPLKVAARTSGDTKEAIKKVSVLQSMVVEKRRSHIGPYIIKAEGPSEGRR